jgi:hypothetical protein
MKRLLSILLTAILCSTAASAQTIRTLNFNSTNGEVIANTGTNLLAFTNTIKFSVFNEADVILEEVYTDTNKEVGIHVANQELIAGGNAVFAWTTNEIKFYQPANFYDGTAANTRTNLFGHGGVSTNISVVGTNSTNTLVFTNGILKEVQ